MKLRHKFTFFAILLHIIFIGLSLFLLRINNYLFFAAEVLIILSIIVTVHLYKSFLKPLNIIAAGVESIKDRDFSTRFVPVGQAELDQLIGVYNRMIDRLREERIRLQEHHYFLEKLIDAAPMGVIILDLDGNVSMINPAAKQLLGNNSGDLIGRSIDNVEMMPDLKFKDIKPGESRIININGIQTYKCRMSHFTDRGFHRHFIIIEELTKEILASQKKAYEKVIRMMSHEINNSVGAINSILNSCLIYRKQLTADDSREFGDALQVAIDRNIGLNKFMSNFADVVRTPPPTMELYNLHELLKSVQVLMNTECEERHIEWQWELSEKPFMVRMDVQQMEQVLVNVIKNSIEAIDNDGTIKICTTGENPPKLRIIDSGKGITSEERQHLFTPFYSTKRNGQGIGLTLVREILINHGFNFNLESKDKGHTEFWIEFINRTNQ